MRARKSSPCFCLSEVDCCWFQGWQESCCSACPSQLSAATLHPPHTPSHAWFALLSLLQVHELNGIKIVTYCSPLYFANSEIFREKIVAKVSNALRNFCLQPIPNGPCSLLYCYMEIIKPRLIMKDGHIHPLLFHPFLPDLRTVCRSQFRGHA